MKLEFNYANEVAALPAGVLREKLASASGTELKLIIALATDPALLEDYDSNADRFAESISVTRKDLDNALAFWRGTGIVAAAGEAAKKPRSAPSKAHAGDIPHYTGEEVEEITKSNDLAPLFDECSRILGRMFNPTDYNSIIAMYQQLGLDKAYIITLCAYCARIDKRSLAYVRKRAYDLYDDGVDTVERLEEYIRRRDELFTYQSEIRRMFGIDGRALSAKESACFEKWQSWGYTPDIVKLAYDITIEKAHNYSISYLDKILTNWYEAGLTTLDEIEKSQLAYAEKKAAEKEEKNGSFDTDEFFEAALRRTRESAMKLLEKEKNKDKNP